MNKEFIKRLILPIAYFIVGILFCIYKAAVSTWICTALGALIAVFGIINLAIDCKEKRTDQFHLASDIITICLGVLTIVLAWVIVQVINVILGILFIIYGSYKIVFGEFIAPFSTATKIAAMIDGILYFVIGILLIVNSSSVYIALGCILMVAGVIDGLQVIMTGIENKNEKKKETSENKDVIDVEATVVEEKTEE